MAKIRDHKYTHALYINLKRRKKLTFENTEKNNLEKTITQDFKHSLSNITDHNLWRLFVDGKKQTKSEKISSWPGYIKREKNFFQDYTNAFFAALNLKISFDSIETIHSLATASLKDTYIKGKFNTGAIYPNIKRKS